MTTDNQSTECTVVCHVRAPLLLEPVDGQVETLQTCESEGTVDTLLLRSWPEQVTISEESPHQEVLETFERYERWADRQGVSIQPPFNERTARSSVTGQANDVLVTPVLCLAIYRDEQLVGVFPHSAADETYTATEAIAALRTGNVPTPLGTSNDPAETDEDTCPDCGGSLVNGQGVFACVDCGWTGTVRSDGQYVPIREDERSAGVELEASR